ncbi:MAG: hypothetical protein E7559_04865 [Ruminococcaceae bacterium]|nr:hypothetical protein [Oscillospiraceae bacterium]
MNIFQKLDILGAILGVNPDALDPEIILDGMPQWNSAAQQRLCDYVRKQNGFTLTAQRLATLTTIQDVLDLM